MHGWNNDILYVWSISPIVFRFYPCIFCFLLSHWSNLAGSSNPTNESEGNRMYLITDRTRKQSKHENKQTRETHQKHLKGIVELRHELFHIYFRKCRICKGTWFRVRSPMDKNKIFLLQLYSSRSWGVVNNRCYFF